MNNQDKMVDTEDNILSSLSCRSWKRDRYLDVFYIAKRIIYRPIGEIRCWPFTWSGGPDFINQGNIMTYYILNDH